jgi:hypothetical protein
MKKFLIILILLANQVGASNDALLTVDSKDSGLCLGLDTPDIQYCQNTTLTIDGTSDHILYILPESAVANPDNKTAVAVWLFTEPWYFILGGFGYMLAIGCIFASLIVILARFFKRNAFGRRK